MASSSELLGVATAIGAGFLQSILIQPKRAIGPIVAQVTLEEVETDTLEITEQPVELGALISDHAFKRPSEVIIKCGWSNSATVPGFLNGLISGIGSTFSDTLSLLDGGSAASVNDVYAQLLQLQVSMISFDVYTGKRHYTNMLVQSLVSRTDKTSENALMITATLKQIIIVQTQVVAIAAPASAQAAPEVTNPLTNAGSKSLVPAFNYNIGAGWAAVNPGLPNTIMIAYEIPLSPQAQQFQISLAGVDYYLNFYWNQYTASWMIDILDANQNMILSAIPVVTGTDLLAQFAYLNFGGALVVQTDYSPDTVPNFTTLGVTGHVYFVTDFVKGGIPLLTT